MSGAKEVPSESVTIGASRERIWELLDDPDALRRVMPGCESLEVVAPGSYAAVLATRAGFVTIRADATIDLRDVARPDALRLLIAGRPRGIGGDFNVSVPIELESLGARLTRVTYKVELALTGRVATLGGSLVGSALHHQIGDLISNVERELSDASRQ